VVYRRGRIAYSRGEVAAGERDLRQAAALFQAEGDPMALMARHYAASARLARNDLAAARADLETVLRDADAHPDYLALGAHVRRELARAALPDDDWARQVPTLTASAALFRRGGEHAGEAFAQSALAAALTYLGRADDAWSARILAFHALSAEAQSDLLPTTINAGVAAELRAGRPETALALSAVSQAAQAPETEPILAIDTLLQRAMLETSNGSVAAAQEATRQATQLAAALPDADLRAWQLADIDVARGAQLLTGDPGNAAAPLTRAIDYYRSRSRSANLPEPLLLRARLFLRTGQPEQAVHDLEEGVQAVEQHPLHYEGVALGTGVLDAGNALFTEAIRLRLERGDTAGAFAYAERARGSRITLPELQRRLAGSGTLVLELVALPAEVVTIAIAHDDVAVARRPRTDRELAVLAARAGAGDEQAFALLYDDLVRPVDSLVARAAALIVVPDPSLAAVPFAALIDTVSRRRLIERLPVAMAASAGSLQPASEAAARSIAALGLPGADGSAALPAAERELADVAALYRRATVVPPDRATWAALLKAAADFDVIHIAGHTERQPGEGEQALLFTMPERTSVERVSWKRIAAAPASRARIVVLAACETLRPPSSHSRALSLGGAFAAGGADVIGTLVPIPDRDAHALFRAVHQHLAAGASAAVALREAQLEAIRDEAAGRGTRAWRAAAVLTRSIR
jgi:CHAT domain-containing protein